MCAYLFCVNTSSNRTFLGNMFDFLFRIWCQNIRKVGNCTQKMPLGAYFFSPKIFLCILFLSKSFLDLGDVDLPLIFSVYGSWLPPELLPSPKISLIMPLSIPQQVTAILPRISVTHPIIYALFMP